MLTYTFERKEKITKCRECPFLYEPYDDIGGMCYDSTCSYVENKPLDLGYLDEYTSDIPSPDNCPLKQIGGNRHGQRNCGKSIN